MISPSAISPLNRRVVEGLPAFSFDNALQFDGVNDYVDLGTVLELSSSAPFTVSFWAKFPGAGVIYPISIKTDSLQAMVVQCFQRDLYFMAFDNSNNSGQSFYQTPKYTDNVWSHYVITYNGSGINTTNFSLTKDGIKSLTTRNVNAANDNTKSYLGRSTATYYAQILDEVAIWNTALSDTDIVNLYNSGNGDYASNYSPANLLAYWRCNEIDGATTLTDEQGTYDGTLTNFSTPPAYFIPH